MASRDNRPHLRPALLRLILRRPSGQQDHRDSPVCVVLSEFAEQTKPVQARIMTSLNTRIGRFFLSLESAVRPSGTASTS